MSKVIASTYEILQEIGAGGGGVVYLGKHTRLNKMIVLKADKRSLSKKPEALRREVDALKDLSHTYIPQVYDFVQEDGVVYTVMDYIAGESLDKPLKRGEHFPQPKLVEWACELLEALAYLHSRPPYGILHSDIKPANIMVTPEGDIRLIDFNIALALGEEGAVRVGRSRGYASPEHYGLDFSEPESKDARTTRTKRNVEHTGASGTASAHASTSADSFSFRSSSSETSGSKTILLDKRSDIYSVGATLYHLFTGVRPEPNAKEVKPITDFPVNPTIARIIQKAMEPNPDRRYQSAEAMLRDFERLHESDPRSIRRRRRMVCMAALCACVLAIGGLLTFVGLRQQNRLSENLVAAGNSREALQAGDVDLAVAEALKALPEERGWLDPPYAPEAQRALANALGVYDLSDSYKPYRLIALKSPVSGEPVKPMKAALSPDGSMTAVLVNELENWWIYVYDTDTGGEITHEPLKAAPSAGADFLFTERGALLYAGENGLTSYNLTSHSIEWSTGRPAMKIALSGDQTTAVTVYRDENFAAVWNAETGEALGREIDFHGRSMKVLASDWNDEASHTLFTLNSTGEWLAVSFADGSVSLYYLPERNEIAVYDAGETDCKGFEGGFYREFFTIVANGGSRSYFMIVGLEDVQPLHFAEDTRAFHVQTDTDGIYLYRPARDVVSQLNPYAETDEGFIIRELAQTEAKITAFRKEGNRTLVTCADGTWFLFDENGDAIRQFSASTKSNGADVGGDFFLIMNQDACSLNIQRWKRHPATDDDFSYDRHIFHLEANVNSDKETALLFWRNEFSVIDKDGHVLAAVEIPEREKLRDQQYRRVGDTDRLGRTVSEDYLELWYESGLVRGYSVKDGSALFAEQGPTPESLGASTTRHEEILETEHYRVVSPLNATPELYDKDTGKRIAPLEADGNLTYIYETESGLIAHYMRDDDAHTRFATLLDEDGQVIADLPQFTDALPDDALVFDDTVGNLRLCRIYSIQSLIALGKDYSKEVKQ